MDIRQLNASAFPDGAPGSKVQGFLEVPHTDFRLPYTLITGEKEGKTVLVTAGVHGSEYVSIEVAKRLAKCLKPTNLCGKVLIVSPVNASAFFGLLPFIMAEDGKNLNRVFPGDESGTASQQLAYFLVHSLMAKADFYMDMHGGDMPEILGPMVFYPMNPQASPEVVEASIQACKALGFRFATPSLSEIGSIGAAASLGVPGFLSEMGCNALWTEAEVLEYQEAINRVLVHVGVLQQENQEVKPVLWTKPQQAINSNTEGFWYPSCQSGQHVSQGEKLGEVRDWFDNVLEEHFAPANLLIIYQRSTLSVTKGASLVAYAEPVDVPLGK